ncbi:MAG: hypothetical protein NT069_04510 [Planctomycetota bacterium]|nr:hypothetical protein [Planctomycetota bacterium]
MGVGPWFEAPSACDPHAAIEIAASSNFRKVWLTRVGPDAHGELVYLKNIRAHFGDPPRSVRYLLAGESGAAARGAQHRWTRLECKVPIGAGVTTKDTLVLATFPRSREWVFRQRFKDRKHKPLTVDPTRQPQPSVESMLKALDGLSNDYWETGKYLTAGMSYPPEPLGSGTTGSGLKRKTLLGVCDDFDGYYQLLLEHDAVKRLLERTADGTIRFWFSKTKAKSKLPRLKPSTQDQADSLMASAVWQALAGPARKDPGTYLGTPVVKWVDRIYRDHLNTQNRRKEND